MNDIKLRSSNNKDLSVSIQTRNRSEAKFNDSCVPAEEVVKLKLATGMSDRGVEIATGMIRGWKSKTFFEPNLRSKVTQLTDGDIHKYFESKSMEFEGEEKTVIYCNSVRGKIIFNIIII